MDVIESIRQRYSCRNYSDKTVSKEQIMELLALANLAPSAGNGQNRQFLVITDEDDRKWLGKMNNQLHMAEAPVDILVTTKLNTETVEEYFGYLKGWEMTHNGQNPDEVKIDEKVKDEIREMKYKWMISDVAAAVENLMLAATSMGLGTCWIGVMDFEGVRKKFKLRDGVVPVCWVTLGYPKDKTESKHLKPIEELVRWG